MAESYMKRYGGGAKEIILVDERHTLQERITDGTISLWQMFGGNGGSPSYNEFPGWLSTNNDLVNYPYKIYSSNLSTSSVAYKWWISNKLTLNVGSINPKIQKYKIQVDIDYYARKYYVGSSISGVIFLQVGNDYAVYSSETEYSNSIVFTSNEINTLSSVIYGHSELWQGTTHPYENYIINSLIIKNIKLVDIKYN